MSKKAAGKRNPAQLNLPVMLSRFREKAMPALREEFGYKNMWQTPSVEKIVVNIGLGEALKSANALQSAMRDISLITGQIPVPRRAKQSVSNFNLREGQTIGAAVTLRGKRMWEFLDRFANIALPRVRDFRGLSPKSFDGRGNCSVGLREQIVFPEIDYNEIDKLRGLQVVIVTTAKTDPEGRKLLELLGIPFAGTRR